MRRWLTKPSVSAEAAPRRRLGPYCGAVGDEQPGRGVDGDVGGPPQIENRIDGTVSGSHVVQVGQLHGPLTVQLAAPRPAPVPRQLPPAPRRFVNRRRELEQLDAAMRDGELGSASVAVVSGMRGVGKTATSHYWAHARAGRFHDGQLHVDFGELRHRGGVAVSDVLAELLRGLGIPDDDIPVGFAERTALFRSTTADKRILLLLDDVEHAAEVQPLIPSTPEAMVLLTTRVAVEELVQHAGASVVRLDPLDGDSARSILVGLVGEARVDAEPDAVGEIVRICAGLPVALRVCGARLAGHHHRPVGWLVAELADETRRLERIRVDADHTIDVVFTEAYRALTPGAAATYRALGLHPGRSFTAPLAAAAAGVSVAAAHDCLDELCTANLVEVVDGRMRFHDLLRIHARGAAERDLDATERERVVRRIAEHELASAQRMDVALIPTRLRLAPPPPAAPDGAPAPRTPAEAIDWFEGERQSLVAVLRAVVEREWDVLAWQLGEALWLAYHNRKHFGEALEVYELGARAAQRCGDAAAEARLRLQLARAYMDLEDFAGAERELALAGPLARQAGHRALEGSTLEFLGVLEIHRGRHTQAIAALESSRDLYRSLDSPRGLAIQEHHLGRALTRAGRHAEAIRCLEHAIELIDPEQDGLTLGRVLLALGEARRALGETTVAAATLERACVIMREQGAPYYEAMGREQLGAIALAAGDAPAARAHWEHALAIYLSLGSPRAADVSARLAAAPGASR